MTLTSPFVIELTEAERRGLEQVADSRAAPFGAGHHPYIACNVDELFGSERFDDARLWDGSFRVGDVTVWADGAWPYVQLFSGGDEVAQMPEFH